MHLVHELQAVFIAYSSTAKLLVDLIFCIVKNILIGLDMNLLNEKWNNATRLGLNV